MSQGTDVPSSKPFVPGATAELRPVSSLPAALLLAAVGGFLDSFLYLGHDRVFAGAMTGNAVLCGIALLGHNGRDALHHLLPLAGFVAGVLGAQWLDAALGRNAVVVGLLAEAGGLLVASFLPASFPDLIFVPLISVLAAYQVTSFKRVDQYVYNSTFLTGNLRTALEGLYQAAGRDKRREGLKKLRELGSIVVAFTAGAVAGAFLEPRMGNHALWLAILLLAGVTGWVVWRRRTEDGQDLEVR